MPRPVITFKKAVLVAEMAMVLQRQTYKWEAGLYDRGVFNTKTENAKQKYGQLTNAMNLFKSLVDPLVPGEDPAQQPIDTNLKSTIINQK